MMSCFIDAFKGRNDATVDITGAFMKSYMYELVHVNLVMNIYEFIDRLNTKLYKEYIQTKDCEPLLYAATHNEIYYKLQSAILFCRKL